MSLDPPNNRTPTNASTTSVSASNTRPWWQLSRLWLVPVVALLATFGVFGVRHPGSVKAMLMNAQGIGVIVAALVVTVIAIWASQFRPKIKPVLPFVATLGILGAAVYAEVPFERNSTQNKTLVSGPVLDGRTATAEVAEVQKKATGASAPATTMRAPVTPTTGATMAVRRAAGQLRGINHTASGRVSIIESPSGEWVARFENFDVQFTPEPVLYLIPKPDAERPDSGRVGPFTATDGDLLDVALPSTLQPTEGWTVLIWCEKFDTPIANATLG